MKNPFFVASLLLVCTSGCFWGGLGLDVTPASSGQIFFSGYMYDGVIGGRIQNYQISLKYRDQSFSGSVDDTGRYVVGPLSAHHDYSIIIQADGYRPFESHNAGYESVTTGSLHMDAYLFPVALQAPAQTIYVNLSQSDVPASGNIRFQPIAGSTLVDDGFEKPAGVGTQVWVNDADIQLQTVMQRFENGQVSLEKGTLVYGVRYLYRIFNVEGHRDFEGLLTAGFDGNIAVTMQRRTNSALDVVYVGADSQTGAFTLVFNQPVQLLSGAELVRVSNILTLDQDQDGQRNVLKNVSDTVTRTYVEDYTMTVGWVPEQSLAFQDNDDPIYAVEYIGFDSVFVAPSDSEYVADVQSLGTLVGDSFTVLLQTSP